MLQFGQQTLDTRRQVATERYIRKLMVLAVSLAAFYLSKPLK
jgi:hypothetical protein